MSNKCDAYVLELHITLVSNTKHLFNAISKALLLGYYLNKIL
jgi:hypothetical protein